MSVFFVHIKDKTNVYTCQYKLIVFIHCIQLPDLKRYSFVYNHFSQYPKIHVLTGIDNYI